MVMVTVGIGSNHKREHNIHGALDQLQQQFGDLLISPVYESPFYSSDNASATDLFYYNLAVCFESSLAVSELKTLLRGIEEFQGRNRSSCQVSLDLDLLLYGDWVGQLQNIVIPHHDIHQCDYVLRPLYDLIPQQHHPVFHKSYADLWQAFTKKEELVAVDFVWQGQVVSQAVALTSL